MSAHDIRSAERPPFDTILQSMADYVMDYDASQSALAMETARYCLIDSLACALMALDYPECTKLLGPVVPGAGTVRRAADLGVLLTGGQRLRLVTHLDVTSAQIDQAVQVLRGALQ